MPRRDSVLWHVVVGIAILVVLLAIALVIVSQKGTESGSSPPTTLTTG
jgi:hypothetical protein